MIDIDIILTLSLLALIFLILTFDLVKPSVVAMTGMAVLLLAGIIDTRDMLDVFSSSAPLTIACMFIITGALTEAGALDRFTDYIRSFTKDHARMGVGLLFVFVFFISAFVNNTVAVVILTPVIIDIAKALDKPEVRFLIPLSFVAILGGMTTLIGTSTNLLVDNIAQDHGYEAFHIFEMSPPALVMAAAGILYLLLFGRFLLPQKIRSLGENIFSKVFSFAKPRQKSLHLPKTATTLSTLFLVVLLSAFNVMPIVGLAFIGAVFLIVTNCISIEQAYRSIDWDILMLIFGMLGIAAAMDNSGAAEKLVGYSVAFMKDYGPLALLACVYLLTSFFTETITNNAVAVILTPLVIGLTESLGLETRPYLIAVMLAASASFATPLGYQTNTYVYMKGGYRFVDFVKIGLPLNLLMLIIALFVIPLFWPLQS